MAASVYVVIVTHNSAKELGLCLAHLQKQTVPIKALIIVDSGSVDTTYLDTLHPLSGMKIIKKDNVGFSRANNFGYREIPADKDGIIVFLNPDTFLTADYLEQAINVLNENPRAAAISGKLLGYDLKNLQPTGKIDSTGIFKRWYGRWYDRGQGQPDQGQYDLISLPPALCGALICCRIKALLPFDGDVFDSDFFLYKEDIELCLRLKSMGWTLIYDPRLIAYHCRGWAGNRRKMSYEMRLMSARNELLLYQKHPGPAMAWAWLKYFLVKVLHV